MAFKPTVIGKSKADIAFCKKATEAVESRDWTALELIFNQYGSYLMLIDSSVVMGNREIMTNYTQVDGLLKA